MQRARNNILSLFASALALGCGGEAHETQGTTAATTPDSPSGSVTSVPGSATNETVADSVPTGTMLTEPGDSTTSTSGSTGPCNFPPCSEDLPGGPCDVFGQDCPEGQKCVPYIAEADNAWDDLKCVPVSGNDEPGEACTSEGSRSGIDSCIKGAICWGLDVNNIGTCIAQCTGTAEEPICDVSSVCKIASGAVLNLCVQTDCNPLLQDCLLVGDGCYPFFDGFICAETGAAGQANDPCELINACDAGLMCADAASVGMGCAPGSTSCCTPFCKFPDGVCLNQDQQCVQYFDPLQLPPGDPYLDVGFCGLPG